jgi:hypothetical protein
MHKKPREKFALWKNSETPAVEYQNDLISRVKQGGTDLNGGA